VTSLAKRLIEYLARKTHNVQYQVLCATIYGLLHLFGIGGTIAIIAKMRKMHKPTTRKVVKTSPPQPPQPNVTV
jgi:hypothetical protein